MAGAVARAGASAASQPLAKAVAQPGFQRPQHLPADAQLFAGLTLRQTQDVADLVNVFERLVEPVDVGAHRRNRGRVRPGRLVLVRGEIFFANALHAIGSSRPTRRALSVRTFRATA